MELELELELELVLELSFLGLSPPPPAGSLLLARTLFGILVRMQIDGTPSNRVRC